MANVNDVIDLLKKELDEDAKLPSHDVHKLCREERTKLLNSIIKLQNSRGNKNAKETKNGVSRNGIKMGRPRRDLNPESEGKAFIRTLEKVISNEKPKGNEEGKQETSATDAGSRDEQVA